MDFNMFRGHVYGPEIVDNGAVHTGWGKFRIHFLGSSNPKELTRRVIIIVVAVALAVLLITTLLAGKEPTNVPYETKLRNAIGQPMEAALVNAGLKTEKLTETEAGVYALEGGVKVDGIQFDLRLYTDDGVLSGFDYTAQYQADAGKAAKDIYNILVDLGMDSYTLEEATAQQPAKISRKAIREHLEQGNDLLIKDNGVNITQSGLVGALKQYFETLEASESWEGKVHGYLVRPAQLYLDRDVSYMQETKTVKIQLSYKVEAERESTYN